MEIWCHISINQEDENPRKNPYYNKRKKVITAAAIFFLAPWVLSLFGKDFDQATWALGFLLLGQVINVAFGPTAELLNMTGNQKKVAIVNAVTAGFHLILILIIIPMYGITGAALVHALSLLLVNTWSYYFVLKYLRINSSALLRR